MSICKHECACPSQLHHEVVALIARYNAPVPRLTTAQMVAELESLIEVDTEAAIDDLFDRSDWPPRGEQLPNGQRLNWDQQG